MRISKEKISFRNILITASLIIIFASAVWGNDPYTIIVHSALADTSVGMGLNELINVIESNSAVDITTYTITDGVDVDSIRNLIFNSYQSAPTAPLYVLLVGAARRDTVSPPVAEHIANESMQNYIPGFYEIDELGHHSLYDNYFVAIDTAGLTGFPDYTYPNVIVGRLPAVSINDIHVYVTKLAAYHAARSTPADWQDDILLVAGDRDRGVDHPSPGRIRQVTNGLQTHAIPPEPETSQIKWSDYADIPSRQLALCNAVNAGKLLVAGMASGANMLNFCDFWYRGSGDGFSATDDLTNANKYPVFLGASCNLGQSDGAPDGTRSVAEDLLFAEDAGAIAFIGPSGFSWQLANYYYATQFLDVLLDYPDWSIGKAFVAAKIDALKNPNEAFSRDTHEMFTLFGDPSLIIYNDSLVSTAVTLETDFELDSYVQIDQNSQVFKANQISNDTARVAYTAGTRRILGGQYYLLTGFDANVVGELPRSMWYLMPIGQTIDSNNRFLTYKTTIPDHPSGKAMVSINGLLGGGGYLSDSAGLAVVTDQYGAGMAAIARTEPVWNDGNKFYAFDLSPHMGATLDYLVVEYDAQLAEDEGSFEAYFDELALSLEWGDEPFVDQINMPSSVVKSTNRTASILATDVRDQLIRGDTLAYAWTASAGYFTGQGPQVTYHAPSYATSNVLITCTVNDLGGHSVERTKYINITSPPPPGCPTFYVLTDVGYEKDNVILTESLDLSRTKQVITDYCPLSLQPDTKGGVIRIKLTEEQDEIAYLDEIALIAVPTDRSYGEELAIRTDGQLVAVANPIPPFWVDSPLGFELTSRVMDKDNQCFEYFGPGELILAFRGLFEGNSPTGKNTSQQRAAEAQQGGIASKPDDKDGHANKVLIQESGIAPERLSNFFTVQTCDGGCLELSKIFPRIRSSLPVLTDLTDWVIDGNARVKISWQERFRADQIAFYNYRILDPLELPVLVSADSKKEKSCLTAISSSDNRYFVLRPSDEIEMAFRVPAFTKRNLQFILKTTGYYIPDGAKGLDESYDDIIVHQNFPNPFNAGTRISFTLAKAAKVKVEIYNILGQKVLELFDGYKPAGLVVLDWDGRSVQGNSVTSGIYYFRISSGGYSDVRKMVLLK